MNDAQADPLPEHFEIKISFQLSSIIEYGILEGVLVIQIPFKHKCKEAGPRCEKYII
jgi:hypothetical protein